MVKWHNISLAALGHSAAPTAPSLAQLPIFTQGTTGWVSFAPKPGPGTCEVLSGAAMAEESQTLSLPRVCHGALQDPVLIWKNHLLGPGAGLLLARRGVEALLLSLS